MEGTTVSSPPSPLCADLTSSCPPHPSPALLCVGISTKVSGIQGRAHLLQPMLLNGFLARKLYSSGLLLPSLQIRAVQCDKRLQIPNREPRPSLAESALFI